MTNLSTTPRPDGQRDDYLFIEDADTGRRFKALHVGKLNPGGDPAVTISIAPVGADGKALANAAGEPDVTTLTHTFTEAELSDPAFDIDARVAAILTSLVERKHHELAGRSRVLRLGEHWGHGGLDLAQLSQGGRDDG